MNSLEIRRYQMLTRVRDFGQSHSDSFPPSSYGSELFAAVNTAVSELKEQGVLQYSSKNATRQNTAMKMALGAKLRKEMSAISQTARTIGFELRGIEERFRMPRSKNYMMLLSTARSFASEAAPLAAEFIKREMPANFLDQFNTSIELFEKAIMDRVGNTAAQIEATATINQVIQEAMKAVRRLDVVVRNKFRSDPATLAAWMSAKHTERASSHKELTTEITES